MKVVYIGTVESSYEILKVLIKKEIKIKAVFTLDNNKYNSDHKSLRGISEENNIRVYGIKNINDKENIDAIRDIKPDLIVVIGISQIIKKEILDIPKFGCIGFHPTLLPKNRGRAAIPWAILNDQKETGVTLFYLDEGCDSGDIISQKKIEISTKETARTLYDKIIISLKEIFDEVIYDILNKKNNRIQQNENEATYCAKREKNDGLINWEKSAYEIDKLIRATSKPYPGAFTYNKGKRLIIWSSEIVGNDNYIGIPGQRVEIVKDVGVKVKTGNGLLLIKQVEFEGRLVNSYDLFKIAGNKFDNFNSFFINQMEKQ